MTVSISVYNSSTGLQEFDNLDSLPSLETIEKVWIDVETDDPEILNRIASIFKLHELSIEDCFDPGHFPKLEEYGTHTFMIFRGLKPNFYIQNQEPDEDEEELTEEEKYTQKVAIYLSEKFIISFRRTEVAWLDAIVRVVSQFPEGTLAKSTTSLAHKIVDVLIDRFTRGIDVFEREIILLEDKVLESPESFELSDLLEIKRDLILLKQIMREQRIILQRLSTEPTLIKEKPQRRFFKDIDDHAQAIMLTLDQYIDSLAGVRDAYFAIANVRLGDTMRILAVITTVAVPLNIVVGLYGMNFEAIPLLHNPHGFWFIVSLMVLVAILLLFFFRRQRWI
ncbi:MAG: magnesium transporter CorA family protein [Bdellovibrionales bacterium]|nr:magnesium transporter CorA family protein [Bdellovibrionales bacterium]